MSHDHAELPIIGLTTGDLNGVGMELIIKTFSEPEMLELCVPVLFGSAKTAAYHRNAIERRDFNFHIAHDWSKVQAGKANLLNTWSEEVNIELGQVSADAGLYAHKSLAAACSAWEEGKIQAIVTAPIHKKSIQSADFPFTGHTDYLEDRFKAPATMLLISEEMRMALATVHIPLAQVSSSISADLLLKKLRSLDQSLKADFGIVKPKIAVLSLNPHAGDGGVIGEEEAQVIEPALQQVREEFNLLCFGPYPSDSFFGRQSHRQFDAVLAMYHDQGLTAFKALSMGEGVNYSAGLPLVRTSPDHGTAFDIAGQGLADESSYREAVYRAIDILRQRQGHQERNAKPLKIRNKKR